MLCGEQVAAVCNHLRRNTPKHTTTTKEHVLPSETTAVQTASTQPPGLRLAEPPSLFPRRGTSIKRPCEQAISETKERIAIVRVDSHSDGRTPLLIRRGHARRRLAGAQPS
ncbi:hypothetical protein CEP51_016663 [Fusarium floridanum]|uniref:Uncharacterized protein n=1 Tax=Fusarium floridanum TaxID=1325733 RepID=A0A428NIU9_9HYPO|nr:hypothetical protein CEP51_016663 [Fusarium floridanum]